jgi:type IV pilus assembly protein PilV
MRLNHRNHRQRGVGLLDAMIALLILSFGLLGMTRFQARMLAQGSESQARLVATQQADELLGMAIIDPTTATISNGPCYAVPTATGCTNPAASAQATAWAARAAAALPGGSGAAGAVWNAANNQLTVTLTWTGKSMQAGEAPDQHQLSVTTDVR